MIERRAKEKKKLDYFYHFKRGGESVSRGYKSREGERVRERERELAGVVRERE